jgi:sugar/nucleoside kinase (ribokinase family)
MSVLVVGSVAFDCIETPYGKGEEILGGSATYFSVSASSFVPVNVVAVVGEDFGPQHLRVFTDRAIDVRGLERADGKTFRWRGEYVGVMNEARTLETQLNVFETFAPKIPTPYLESEFVFLGNIHPTLQLHVRQQLTQARLVACDTMNYWIIGTPEQLKRTLAQVDMLLINEGEARLLSGSDHLKRAAAEIRKLGPRIVVIKRASMEPASSRTTRSFSPRVIRSRKCTTLPAPATPSRAASWATWPAAAETFRTPISGARWFTVR